MRSNIVLIDFENVQPTLSNSISTLFLKQLSDEEVSAVVSGLVKRGTISVAGTKVTYSAISDASRHTCPKATDGQRSIIA